MSTPINSGHFPVRPPRIKMNDRTWNYLYSGIARTLVKHGLHPFTVDDICKARQAMYKAMGDGQVNIHLVYANCCQCGEANPCSHGSCPDGLNDNHINTALKAMFKGG